MSRSKVHEALTRAYEMIEDPNNWTMGAPVDGCKYCVGGAIAKAITGAPEDMYNYAFHSDIEDAFKMFIEANNLISHAEDRLDTTVYEFNDLHEHADVLEALQTAIQAVTLP